MGKQNSNSFNRRPLQIASPDNVKQEICILYITQLWSRINTLKIIQMPNTSERSWHKKIRYCTSSLKRCSPKVTVQVPLQWISPMSLPTIQMRVTVFHIHSILLYSATDLDIAAQQTDFSQINSLIIIGWKHSFQLKKSGKHTRMLLMRYLKICEEFLEISG